MGLYISGKCVDDLYKSVYESLVSEGMTGVKSRIGDTTELLHVTFSLTDPRQRMCTVRRPMMSLAYAFAELIYTLKGSNEAAFINAWNPLLTRYQGDSIEYPGAYGFRLRRQFGFDQIERVYETLKSNPDSRQVVMQIWNPELDLPIKNGKPNNQDIPCNIVALLKIRNNKLHWTQIMRSNDIVLGFPYDIFLFSLLQEIIAGWLECDMGEYTHFSDSLHMYSVKMSLSSKVSLKNIDDLRLSKKESDQIFPSLYLKMNDLRTSDCQKKLIEEGIQEKDFPKPYHNIFMVLCSYISYKIKNPELARACLESCDNMLYVYMMETWMNDKKFEI